MKIVIDITEETVNEIKDNVMFGVIPSEILWDVTSAFVNGIPLEPTGKCRTCKYGEIYNDLWCKCHDPLLNGVMVKMTDQCRAEEIVDLNRKYKAERSDKE